MPRATSSTISTARNGAGECSKKKRWTRLKSRKPPKPSACAEDLVSDRDPAALTADPQRERITHKVGAHSTETANGLGFFRCHGRLIALKTQVGSAKRRDGRTYSLEMSSRRFVRETSRVTWLSALTLLAVLS